MKRFFLFRLVITTVLAAVVFGLPVLAAPASTGIVPNCAPNCTVCDLLKLIQNLINFLVEISVPVAAAMILGAGITILSAGSSQKRLELGKTVLTNAIVGFAIVVGSWLIINTLLNIFGGSGVPLPWNTIQC